MNPKPTFFSFKPISEEEARKKAADAWAAHLEKKKREEELFIQKVRSLDKDKTAAQKP